MVWQGHPTDVPAIGLKNGKVYVSWNGATNVARWQVLTGGSSDGLKVGPAAAKSGFETAIQLPAGGKYVAVQALDSGGKVLAVSKTLKR